MDLQVNVYQKYYIKLGLLTLLTRINLNFGKPRESDTPYLLALPFHFCIKEMLTVVALSHR